MDNTLVTAKIVAAMDNCPWVKADNMIQASHDAPKWFDQIQEAWTEVVGLGKDATLANVEYVNSRLGTALTADWIWGLYGVR